MIEIILVAVPLLAGGVCLFLRGRNFAVRLVLLVAALLHAAAAVVLLSGVFDWVTVGVFNEWLEADKLSKVFLAIVSFLFLCACAQGFSWLPYSLKYEQAEGEPMAVHLFGGALALFAATMSLAVLAKNFGLLWVAVEATTLASAPLIMFHRSKGALEAMWKYLLICSVGIGLALFGTFMLEIALRNSDGSAPGLSFAALGKDGLTVHTDWFKAAFVFCFAGYGLKMGLAPFHFWLPDAHSEAPSMVSVMLSGALLNCSFLAIIRVMNIAPAELHEFCCELLVCFGVLSLAAAAVFMIKQKDFKRMLAYSSCEHMGLLAIFWGIGACETGLLHMGVHSLLKMMLFLTAGNILMAYGSRKIAVISGMFSVLPKNALLWLSGIILICGMPPSPLFITEYRLIMAAGGILGAVVLILLFVVFAAMTSAALKMTTGSCHENVIKNDADKAAEELAVLPLCLLGAAIAAGILLICREAGMI